MTLNRLGDSLVPTTGRHGSDIAGQRLDELDALALVHAIETIKSGGACVDLGSGAGIQGLRFATFGYATVLIDLLPIEKTVCTDSAITDRFSIEYIEKDARSLVLDDLPDRISIVFSQRFIHYLTFDEATQVLRVMRGRMQTGDKLFLSASGLHSELGVDYGAGEQPVESRFGVLAPPMQTKHQILEPVCLYSPEDLVRLGTHADFTCENVYSSEFGNVKGVFSAA